VEKDDNNINTGGGAYIRGNVNVGGSGTFVGRDDNRQTGANLDEIEKLFNSIYSKIEDRSGLTNQDKIDMKSEVDEIRQELSRKENINEGFIMRRLRNVGRMAPDILEVALAVIANPAAGFGVIGIKIAEKIKASAG
jgi:hypothetical protein